MCTERAQRGWGINMGQAMAFRVHIGALQVHMPLGRVASPGSDTHIDEASLASGPARQGGGEPPTASLCARP